MIDMKHRIWKEKICLVAKMLHRTEVTKYCRLILEEQILMGWEGLAKETGELIELMLPKL